LHDVAIAKADAAVRSGVTDRVRLVGSVDAKAFLAEADPSWADGVVAARRDDRTRVVVSRVSEAIDDLEFAGGAWADRSSNRDWKSANNLVIFEDCQFPVGNTDNDLPMNRRGRGGA